VEAAKALKARAALIDGEAVVLVEKGRSRFQFIQGAFKGRLAGLAGPRAGPYRRDADVAIGGPVAMELGAAGNRKSRLKPGASPAFNYPQTPPRQF
jgi:hypothetical protein